MKGSTRRDVLRGMAAVGVGVVGAGGGRARAQASLHPLSATFGPTSVLNAVNMVVVEQGFARAEGLDLKLTITDAGAKARQILAAGEAAFAHGDATHPLQLSNRGKAAKILMATETIATSSIMVVRNDLYEAGVDTPEKFANWKRPDGAKPIIAATAIGSSTWMFGSAIFEKLGLGGKVNWISGGGGTTMLGALKSSQVDAIMAVPSWQFQAEDRGWGKAIFDISRPGAWDAVFGGPLPAAVIYALDDTVSGNPDVTQAYVNALYRSMQWLRSTPADAVYAKLGPKYLGEFEGSAIAREIAYYQKVWNYSGAVTEADYKRAAPVWYREGTGISPIAYKDAVEPGFLANAARKYG